MGRQEEYQALLLQYAADLARARAGALGWWEALVARQGGGSGDRGEAERECRMRWPMGPASHPRVIAVYRRYFLEATRLNERLAEERARPIQHPRELWGISDEVDTGDETIEPVALLFEGLEDIDKSLFAFMAAFVFTPIGIDPDGHLA